MDNFKVPAYIVGKNKNYLIVTDNLFSKFWKLEDDEFVHLNLEKICIPDINLNSNGTSFFNFNCRLSIEDLNAVIIGIPYSKGSLINQSKADEFPMCLREYSLRRPVYENMEDFSSSGIYDLSENEHLFRDLKFQDLGDLELSGIDNIDKLNILTRKFIKYTFDNNISAISIGGDHSITYSFVNSLALEINRPIVVIIFDSHHDCRNSLYMVDEEIHHANFVRYLIEIKNVVKVIQIGVHGIRSLSQMLVHEKLVQFSPRNISLNSINDVIKDILHVFPDAVGYLSIDLDVINSNEFPFVDFPVPDGMKR